MNSDPLKPPRPWLHRFPERSAVYLPAGVGAIAILVFIAWWFAGPTVRLDSRIPGADRASGESGDTETNPVAAGRLTPGPGHPSDLPGYWPGFRGPARDGIAPATPPLARTWESTGPRQLWAIEVGEGYAGPAVANGRVYLMDYDRENRQDAVRCLSLADGQEIWRFAYPVAVKRNHGMSRTVAAVAGRFLVTIGPKCHVTCLDAESGTLVWSVDLVKEFGTTVPPWYAGQCPLIENGLVILAPGGPDALLLALELETGKVVWQTPNRRGWKMTHASVMPAQIDGLCTYVYCASGGIVGVSSKDGQVLWETSDWKISIATVPSPVILEHGLIFLSGGYNAGSLMLRLVSHNGGLKPETVFRLDPKSFGATQQTPIYYRGHLYGVRPDGQFVCLDPEGKILWTSGPTQRFDLGSYLVADGLIFALNDSGTLTLIEATPAQFNRLAQARVLQGRESWGPMALAGTRLLVRDLTRMLCLEVGSAQ